MISRRVLSALLFAVFCASSPALFAAEFCRELLHGVCVPDCIPNRCCDDYCAKPMPVVCRVQRFCCDDYCAKPSLCPVYVKQFHCDDFCPKTRPYLFCPPRTGLKCQSR